MGIFNTTPKVGDRYSMKGDPNHTYTVVEVGSTVSLESNLGIYGEYSFADLNKHFKKIK